MDTETDGNVQTTSIYNYLNRRCDKGTPPKTRRLENNGMAGTSTSTMAKTRPERNHTTPRSTRERPSTNTTQTNTTTDGADTTTTNNTFYERRRRESESTSSSGDSRTYCSDEEEEDTTGRNYFTFIIHKENQAAGWQAAKRNKPSPTFITFDHGDHYHILYASDERGGNIARQRNRIANYLGATAAGITEVTSTNNKVRFLRRFIQYCICNGIKTANKYGIRITEEMREAYEIFQTLYNNRDPNEINKDLTKCKGYIEDAKENARISKVRRRNVVDTIQDLLQQHDINTNTEWNIKIDKTIKHQLLREYGLSVRTAPHSGAKT